MSRRDVEWATFDCYGTLVDWEGGVARVLRSLLSQRAAELGDHEIAARYITAEAEIESGAYASYRTVLARSCRRACESFGVTLEPGREVALPDSLVNWQPFPETAEALRALRALGVKIAILSNVDRDLIAASISRLGVEPDLLVTAEDAKSYKPAPGHWQTFEAASGARPSATVHVGASIYHDMIPAAARGYRTVFINRHAEPVVGCAPIAALPDLRGLPRVVGELLDRA
jgi:2-haloacid dehalogenase